MIITNDNIFSCQCLNNDMNASVTINDSSTRMIMHSPLENTPPGILRKNCPSGFIYQVSMHTMEMILYKLAMHRTSRCL